jgi:hypothetical protein
MKLKNSLILSLLAGFSLLAGSQLAAEQSVYGHISFVDNEAKIIRADGGENQAVVNLPVLPGDTVATPAGGRCELQFDNGTVVRLDKDSRLRLATVLAPSLTSNWEITTLELEKGQLYTLPQSYGQEMFQILTPNAAVNLKSQVRATIRLDADGGTSFFSDGGKFQLLYGADSRSLKKATVKTDHPLAITAANVPAERVEKRNIEFMAWNEYVDRHFKDLHYGINKIPPKLTKFKNKALTYWAEKWSSLYGEWIYDELFGYVWRPADDRFAFSQRPFFFADFMRINGELFLVPQELWAWVPAHMGTWVWMKRGWTWIPGDWLHNGIVDYRGIYTFPTFGYYWDTYYSYLRPTEWNGWPIRRHRKPQPPKLPDPVITIIKKVAKAPDADKSGIIDHAVPAIDGKVLPPAPGHPTPVPGDAAKAGPAPLLKTEGMAGNRGEAWLKRDWNPDSRWAARNGLSIRYSSAGNSVVCPELKVSSTDMDRLTRTKFRDRTSGQHHGLPSAGSYTSGQAESNPGQQSNGTAHQNQGGTGEHAKGNDKGK